MPIKFRCQHCRQFLGISRAKSGDVFDCPTCGRTLRVPDLDGSVKPLPTPGLNMQDNKLAKALAELADIGKPVETHEEPPESARDSGPQEIVAHQRAEPIDLPPLRIPKPIQVGPRPPAPIAPPPIVSADASKDEAASDDLGWRETRQADGQWKAAVAAAVVEVVEGDSSDEPVIAVEPIVASAAQEPVRNRSAIEREGEAEREPSRQESQPPALVERMPSGAARPTVRRVELSPSFWFACVGVAAIVFTAGFWVGRLTAFSGSSNVGTPEPNSTTAVAVGTAPLAPSAKVGAKARETPTDKAAAIRGRITYRTEAGDRKPDRGARVIALPNGWTGSTKLQPPGFRVGDSADDQRVARAAIQAMGGDLAVTNDSGEYSLTLASSGQYQLVVLSNSLARPKSDDVQTVTNQLSVFFDRATQLLGSVMVHVESVKYSGQGTEPWDFSFQRS